MRRNLSMLVVVVPFLLGPAAHTSASDRTGVRSPEEGAGFPPASVFVEQQTDCMAISDIKSALTSVLSTREESRYMIVMVVVSPAVDGTLAVLRAIERETGEILLERTLSIMPEECADAHLVLKVMLEQFLTVFPIEKWKEKQEETPRAVEPLVRTERVAVETTLHWLFFAGIDSRWPSPSGDVEITLGLDAGARRHGVIGQVAGRVSRPDRLGEGRYLESAALLALGWRFAPNEKCIVRTELRAGTLMVSGIGYEKNYREWLFMVEVQLSVLWRVGLVYLGPEAAISPLFYTASTESGERKDLPWIRLGILLGIPLGKSILK